MRHIAPPTNQQAPGAAAKSPGAKKPQPTPSRGVDVVLRLQRTIGNRAVEAMLRASGATPPGLPGADGATHDEEDEALDAGDPGSGIMRKPRLEVAPADDPFEDEADRVAGHVMRAPGGSAAGDEPEPGAEEHAEPESAAPPLRVALQSKPGDGDEDGAPEPPPIVDEVLSEPGQPLDDDTRAFMEERFGREFDQVRLHTGGRAAESARAVNATAFTVGRDLVFDAGAYSPGTASGKALIAHELTHVVQQGAAPSLPGGAHAAAVVDGASAGGGQPRLARKRARHGDGEVDREAKPAAPGADEQTHDAASNETDAAQNETPADAEPSGDESSGDESSGDESSGDERELAPSLSAVEEQAQRAGDEAAAAAREAEPAEEGAAEEGAAPEAAAEAVPSDAEAPAQGAPAKGQGSAAPEQAAAGGGPAPAAAPEASEPPAANAEAEADEMDDALAAAAGSPQAVDDTPAAVVEPEAAAPAKPPEIKAAPPEIESSGESGSASEAAASPVAPPPGFADLEPGQPSAADRAETAAATSEAPPEEDTTPAPDTVSPTTPAPSPGGSSSGGAAPDAAVSSLHPQSALDEVGEHAASNDLLPAERSVAMDMLAEEGRGGASGGAPGGAGGGGGDGGGAAVAPAKAAPAPPDVSGSSPAEALAQVAQLEPVQLGASLGGLKASVQHDVGERRTELAAAPPSIERPIGSPITKAEAPPPGTGVVPSGEDPLAVASAPKGADVTTPAAKPVPEAPPTFVPPTPQVSADAEGKMSDGDAARMQSQLARMSTRVQGVPNAGAAPTVSLVGNANPQQMRAQHDELRDSLTDARVKGAKDAATPLGEHALYPDVPEETLTATLPAGGAAGAASAAGAGGAPPAADGMSAVEADDAVAVIAREEKGAEVAGAVARASGGVSAAQSRHTQSVADAHSKNTTALAEAEAQNAAAQDAERKRAQSDVKAQRGEWSAQQSAEIRSADQEASEKISTTATDVEAHRADADSDAQKEIDTGNEKAEAAREEGERKAEAEKARGKEESDGFFGWLASKAKAAFDAVKAGIKAALDFARKAIKAALDAAKKLATELIERARKWIADKIKAAGDFLIALGDRVLANFPALRDKFRSAIQGLVAAAEDAINRLADGLKKAVTALLDAWGAALDAALGLLEAGLMAAIDIVAGAVQGAIKFAKGIAEALGTFAQLIADIASSPGAWISNLGAAIIDGLKNHLWAALKQAAQEWFNAKLEGILSVGKTIWAIVTGQLGFSEIAKMAWQAILALLPPVLAQILIEKLVAMIVPAAGAILAIVEGLRAAWGTVSRIIAAIDTFVAFLKAVKGGNAGPQFARALASAAIVVLDFVANFLLLKLGKGLMKLGGKLKGIAKRLMKKRKAAGAPKRPKKAKGKDERGESKQDPKKEKPKDKDKKESDAEKKRKILDKAVRELPPLIQRVLDRGVRGIVLQGRLLVWRLRYRLSALELTGGGKTFQIRARVNPEASIIGGVSWTDADIDELLLFVRTMAKAVLESSPRVQREARDIVDSEREKELATKVKGKPRMGRQADVPAGTSDLGLAEGLEQTGPLARGKVRDVRALGTSDEVIATVRQQQPRFAPAPLRGSTQIVLEPSATGKGYEGGKYFEITKRVLKGEDPALRGPVTANALERFGRTGEVATGFTANQLHALRVTMFAAEHTRSPAAAVWGTMSMDLLRAGKTPEQILGSTEAGGLHPLSPKGVGEDKKALEDRLDQVAKKQAVGKANAAQERQIAREVKIIKAWIETLKDLKFDDNASDQQKKEEIKARIKRRMEDAVKEEPKSEFDV